MKKIISTISILAIVISIHSCRSQAEDLETEKIEQKQTRSIFQKNNDSITVTDTTNIDKPSEGDPPPKNGHQW
ncbi:MAG: hypothetical protein DI529_02875 [Chryseobacterium sp.]|nr:MAG: hypothetical protein DI529_02875 [Chryseobacterium sp.]